MLSILIPVYNEEKILRENVLKLFQFLKDHGTPFEILVVDNGSTDRSVAIAQELQKEFTWFRGFSLPEKSVGRAFEKGVREARYPNVISMDADLSVDLTFIKHAEFLLTNSAMVVGSKTLGRQKRSLVRVLGSQIYLIVTQVLFQMTITDFSMGAKAFKKEAILPILSEIDFWTAYVFEICVWLNLHNHTIVQIGVNCVDERKSGFNIWHEGFYRYQNLFRVWRRLKDTDSWFHRISSKFHD